MGDSTCFSSSSEGRKEGVLPDVSEKPSRLWSDGVDMDFFRVCWLVGSLGLRVGQGVSGM